MPQLPTLGFDQVVAVLPHALVGTVLMIACAALGWWEGGVRRRRAVRVISWWLARVICPLIAIRSWSGRTAIIVLNNSTVCAVLVLMGMLGRVAWLGVAVVGASLGIALRLLCEEPTLEFPNDKTHPKGRRLWAGIGIALNLLEVPAIMLNTGLSLAQGALFDTISSAAAWELFAVFVLPTLVIAAAGESLWMGIDRPRVFDYRGRPPGFHTDVESKRSLP